MGMRAPASRGRYYGHLLNTAEWASVSVSCGLTTQLPSIVMTSTFQELKGEMCCLLMETPIDRHDLLSIIKNNWLYGLNVNPRLIWYTFKKPGIMRSWEINSSPQLLSSVSFWFEIESWFNSVGWTLSGGHYLSNILLWAQSVSIYNTHISSDFTLNLSCIIRRSPKRWCPWQSPGI